ncbi:hypothetical protein E2C01_044424 [Portunus trituberculatus]|uniref:Uncharacterized protein n=1 Tax=Portunus trituberculatus TaxID=210409 RepID=A0A5B7FZ72_PORTR|nr:hypothetical protein [Portunus trituberculatus]
MLVQCQRGIIFSFFPPTRLSRLPLPLPHDSLAPPSPQSPLLNHPNQCLTYTPFPTSQLHHGSTFHPFSPPLPTSPSPSPFLSNRAHD